MRSATRISLGSLGALVALVVAVQPTAANAGWPDDTTWSQAQKLDTIAGNSTEVNTTSVDGCPHQSPDGLSLYMASNRPGGLGGLDIWVSHRPDTASPWGAPENLGEPVNSAADDFCPTPVQGRGLYFVSREALSGSCGMGDIYLARYNGPHGWREPKHLGCAPNGPNTALDEQGPSYVEADGAAWLYFSSGADIYAAPEQSDGSFGAGLAVTELNSSASDIQPNVRRDGKEVVFASNDTTRPGSQGGFDIYVATRSSVDEPWGVPVNLGTTVNTAANETRPSLSWDARQLLFGIAPGPEGQTDIYVSTRE